MHMNRNNEAFMLHVMFSNGKRDLFFKARAIYAKNKIIF
jgi:hypothetical protein